MKRVIRSILVIAALVMTIIISDTVNDIYKTINIKKVYKENGITYIHLIATGNNDKDVKRVSAAIKADGKKIVRLFNNEEEYITTGEIDSNNNIEYKQGA